MTHSHVGGGGNTNGLELNCLGLDMRVTRSVRNCDSSASTKSLHQVIRWQPKKRAVRLYRSVAPSMMSMKKQSNGTWNAKKGGKVVT